MKGKLLVVTPAFSGGSWICIERILQQLQTDYRIVCAGLGGVFHRQPEIKYYSIPFPRYDKWGYLTNLGALISMLWNLPLLLLAIIFGIFSRNKAVITNGFAIALMLLPFRWLFGGKMVVMYHGYIAKKVAWQSSFLRFWCAGVDLVVVNSRGSVENVLDFIPRERIVTNEHFAENRFFEKDLAKPDGKIIIQFVGRLDSDKMCLPLIEAAERIAADTQRPDLQFRFIGVGEFQDQLSKIADMYEQVEYFGYVSDREKISALISEADVVWSYADETYLTLPAVEALASGTPIIIPKYAALTEKIKQKITIDSDLVPKEIGWIIDPFNPEEVASFLCTLEEKQLNSMRSTSREYARSRYSEANLRQTVIRIKEKLNK